MLLQFCKWCCWIFASKIGRTIPAPYQLCQNTYFWCIYNSALFNKKSLWDMVQDCPSVLYPLWKDCTSVSPQLEQASLKKSSSCIPCGQHTSMFLARVAFLISVFLHCWPLWVVVANCFQENWLLCFLPLTNCCYSVITVPPSMEDTRRKLLF